MALSTYYLVAYPIPNTILESISKLARKFLWARGGNGSGIPWVGWNMIALKKTEGAFGLGTFIL